MRTWIKFTLLAFSGVAGALLLEAGKLPFWQAVPGIALLIICGRIMEEF